MKIELELRLDVEGLELEDVSKAVQAMKESMGLDRIKEAYMTLTFLPEDESVRKVLKERD